MRWTTRTLRHCVLALQLVSLAALWSCTDNSPAAGGNGDTGSSSLDGVGLVQVFAGLDLERPLFLTSVPDGSGRLVVVEQQGTIQLFENRDDVAAASPLVDLRGGVHRGHNEEGLLGLAFHPRFTTNRQVFLHYSARSPRRGVIARFTMDPARERIEDASEEVLLEIPQPYGNHNGGSIEFGPDGYLYIGLGDGGSGGDPQGNGQNKGTLLGAILRIDVDSPPTGGLGYSIPADNPFVGDPAGRDEIWAYGLRNPWRFSFDRQTGDLWVGDVGQGAREEIDLVTKGGNYGWNAREGSREYRRALPGEGPFLDPVIDYDRDDARSITGGYVYRGSEIPELAGAYVHGDYETGNVWALWHDGTRVTRHESLGRVSRLSSFGEDADGELYAVSLGLGAVYRISRIPEP